MKPVLCQNDVTQCITPSHFECNVTRKKSCMALTSEIHWKTFHALKSVLDALFAELSSCRCERCFGREEFSGFFGGSLHKSNPLSRAPRFLFLMKCMSISQMNSSCAILNFSPDTSCWDFIHWFWCFSTCAFYFSSVVLPCNFFFSNYPVACFRGGFLLEIRVCFLFKLFTFFRHTFLLQWSCFRISMSWQHWLQTLMFFRRFHVCHETWA